MATTLRFRNLSHQLSGVGNDWIWGGGGADRIHGDVGNDSMWGGAGADILVGGMGNDTLRGEDGNDVLVGGQGSDSLTGGSGADKFVFVPRARQEKDVISDFTLGEDILSLQGGVTIASQTEVNGSTVLKLTSGALVTLLGVSLTDWSASAGTSVQLKGTVDTF